MSDHDEKPNPIDKAYVRAEAMLDDDAARAARRARVLAAVAREAAPIAPPRRPVWRWAPYAAAASVAGLGLYVALETYRFSHIPPEQPSAVTGAQPQATIPAAALTPPVTIAPPAKPAPAAARVETAPVVQAREVPSPPSSPPPVIAMPAPPPVQAAPMAFPAAPPAPPAPSASADISGQGSRATLTLLDGQRLAAPSGAGRGGGSVPPPPPPAPMNAPVVPAAPPPANSVASVGTTIAGVRNVGSPIQTRTREDMLRSGYTDLSSSLNTLPRVGDLPVSLRAAAAAGRTAEIETLLDQGAAIDAADVDGNTALMLAIRANRVDAAVLLRRRGASLDRANNAGQTATSMARTLNSAEMNRALGLGP